MWSQMDNQTKNPHRTSPGKRKVLRYPEEKSRKLKPLGALMLLGFIVAVGALASYAILAPPPSEGTATTSVEVVTLDDTPSLPVTTLLTNTPTPTESATPRPPTATLTLSATPTATATPYPACNDKDKLITTPPPPCSYTVQQEGEILSGIAQKVYGVGACYLDICDANGIKRGTDCDEFEVHVDDVYVLPECVR
jgi:hypothetical protein